MATRGACAAARSYAAHRRADGACRKRPGISGLLDGIPGGAPEARVDGRPEYPIDSRWGALDDAETEETIRKRTHRAEARPYRYAKHTANRDNAATNADHSRRVCCHCRSGWQRFRSKLARPGGNATGFTIMEPTITGKWLELLKEIAPRVNRAAFLFNPATTPYANIYLNPFKAAAASLGLKAVVATVHDTAELDTVIAAQAREPNGGLIVMPDGFLNVHRAEVILLAARNRLPVVYPWRFFAEQGGLLSYGSEQRGLFRRRGELCEPHPQRREASRPAGPGADGV